MVGSRGELGESGRRRKRRFTIMEDGICFVSGIIW